MTTVTLGESKTPSQQIVEDANRVVKATDTKGRVIDVRRIDMATEIRIAKAISAENASKDRYMALVNLASCVVAIDGEPVSPPRTELQFEALLTRLGSDGFTAVAGAMREHFLPKEDQEGDLGK